MKDLEKNYTSEPDLSSVISRHTDEYNLSIARSNPEFANNVEKGRQLKKVLKARQVSMIALGGAIGTGLVVGTGSALKQSGPGAILVAYSMIGFVVWIVLTALGEVASYIVLPGGFSSYAKRYCSDSLGAAVGYTYLFKYLFLPPNQLVAGALTMQYWLSADRVSPGVWVAVILVVILLINLLGVKVFGEIEFWMSLLKVFTCLGLILLLLIIALGGGPDHDRRGFRYWQNPGAFLHYVDASKNLEITGDKGRFVAFLATLVNAVFAFTGTELVAITFAEAARPRKSIPKAIKLTLYRIVVFYFLSVLFVGMCVSAKDKLLLSASGNNASASPFVIAIKNARIGGLDHVINACILLFVTSAANSDMYVCSRTIYGLSVEGYAPKFFSKTNKMGVPYYGIALSFAFCLLAFMNLSSSSAEVFTYFVNVVSLAGLLAWACILVIHIRFTSGMRAQGIPRSSLPYRAPLQPVASYVALGICTFVILIKNFTAFLGNTFTYKSFITGYIILPVFFIIFTVHKLWNKTKFVKASEMDFTTYLDVIEAEEEAYAREEAEAKAVWEAEGKPKNGKWWYDKVFGWIF